MYVWRFAYLNKTLIFSLTGLTKTSVTRALKKCTQVLNTIFSAVCFTLGRNDARWWLTLNPQTVNVWTLEMRLARGGNRKSCSQMKARFQVDYVPSLVLVTTDDNIKWLLKLPVSKYVAVYFLDSRHHFPVWTLCYISPAYRVTWFPHENYLTLPMPGSATLLFGILGMFAPALPSSGIKFFQPEWNEWGTQRYCWRCEDDSFFLQTVPQNKPHQSWTLFCCTV